MHIHEIITESKNNDQLDELDMAQVGRGAAKVAKGVATGVGAVAGGLVGAGKAFMKGFRKGKGLVGGDDDVKKSPQSVAQEPTSTTTRAAEPQYAPSNAVEPVAKTVQQPINMKVIKSSIQALPKNQRAQLRKIVAAKAGVA